MLRNQSNKTRIAVFAALCSCVLAGRANAQQQQQVAQVQIVADGMCCNGCAQKVGAQLYTAPGVSNVQADVPNHLVTVTFRPSPKLTLGGLWAATERADGKPSKLVTSQAIYTLQRPEQLRLTEPLQPGRYWVVVEKLGNEESTAKAIKQLSSIRNVKSVSCDAPNRTFFLETASTEPLSPWMLLAAVEQCGSSAQSITGPHGVFTIERPKQQAVQSTASQQSQQQGIVR